MNSTDTQDPKVIAAQTQGLRAANAKAAAALKLCIAELQLWMKTHGDDLDTQEAIFTAQAALRKLAIFAN